MSTPSTSSSHLRLPYSSCNMTLGKTQMKTDHGLHHLGKPRACTPSGQLQTTLEHHHPAPAQLTLHRGWRVVVSGHNQSLQQTDLCKSLPLTYQQQVRLNYKRRVYTAYTEGTPWVPSLGDRRGCATGPYRTPTILGHTTKTRNHSSSTQYIETNTGRLPKWADKEHSPDERTDLNSRERTK